MGKQGNMIIYFKETRDIFGIKLREQGTCLPLLRFSITCGLKNSKLSRQMRFLLPSIKCSTAPLNFRLCCLNCAQRFDLIAARSAVVGSWEEPPNILIDGSEKRILSVEL